MSGEFSLEVYNFFRKKSVPRKLRFITYLGRQCNAYLGMKSIFPNIQQWPNQDSGLCPNI